MYIDQIYATFDKQKQAELWSKLGDVLFKNHHVIPLFWLPTEAVLNGKVIAEYPWPGNISGTWTHVEYLKAA